jgi:hypothetical protein
VPCGRAVAQRIKVTLGMDPCPAYFVRSRAITG